MVTKEGFMGHNNRCHPDKLQQCVGSLWRKRKVNQTCKVCQEELLQRNKHHKPNRPPLQLSVVGT